MQCGRKHFILTQTTNNLISTKIIGWTFRNWKIAAGLQLAKKLEHFNKSSPNFTVFINIPNDVLQKKNENCEFVRGVNFEFTDSLKNNGTKSMLIFDNCCDEIFNSEVLVDIATTGRHRGLSTIYNRHNLFHQSKLGRDVELQTLTLFSSSLPVT